MSGSAALSAARKRRASTAQPMSGNGQTPQTMYNNRVPPSVVPGVSFSNEPPKFIQPYPQHAPGNGFPPQPMNIYENIELIKQQLIERTKLIQTQGSTLPPERLNMLHKQNEIQTQILKQKIEIAKQMELANPQTNVYDQRGPLSMSSSTEPEFIYERGVPRKNPNYKTGVQNGSVQRSMGSSNDTTIQVKPFVSMISDTGVIPPPIVILKSHDAKLEEHNQILTELAHQLSDVKAKVKSGLSNTSSNADEKAPKIASTDSSRKINHFHREEDVDEAADEDEEEEEELLMDVVMNDLTNSREFVEGIVNKIVNETNLSEVIMKIEPVVKENQELRSLIHSQQQMMNEMNTMLLRLMNQNNMTKQPVFQDNGLDSDGLYEPEMTEIVLSKPVQEEQSPVKSSEDDVKPESETTTQESSDNSQAVIENQPTVNASNDTHDAPHSEDEVFRTVDPNDQDEQYSGPHFPKDSVSLIINEIQ
jgi:hypothetical protein